MKNFEGFKVEKADEGELEGTCLQGYIDASYDYLLEMFGEHEGASGDGKVQAEWMLKINGVVVTIYDWKYYDTPVERVKKWNIGGHGKEAAEQLKNLMGKCGDSKRVCSVRVGWGCG